MMMDQTSEGTIKEIYQLFVSNETDYFILFFLIKWNTSILFFNINISILFLLINIVVIIPHLREINRMFEVRLLSIKYDIFMDWAPIHEDKLER
jgi:hypothetical protein